MLTTLQAHEMSSMYTMFKVFGYSHTFHELNGRNIHSLENILTLELNTHVQFDLLQLWFEHYTSHVSLLMDV